MTSFATLVAALDARGGSTRGVHYVAGESSERTLPYRELRGRAVGLLHHLQEAGARPASHVVILVESVAPFAMPDMPR